MPQLYIGLMSGTSLDGIDAALVEIDKNKIKLLFSHQHPIETKLKQKLHTLALNKGNINLDDLGSCDSELGDAFAAASIQLMKKASVNASQITAIGSHGQTIRHQPKRQHPFSLQIGDANRIAYKTGIITISDFRRKDMAAGGQGAPLTPAFHQAMFSSRTEDRAILNIGGISNLTYLPKDNTQDVIGFDCGPGNTLMDSWIHKHKNEVYDKNGDWAASGKVHQGLLEKIMADRFIKQQPPKSTGREHYHLDWLQHHISQFDDVSPQQIQATLCNFTAQSIQYAVQHFLPTIEALYICGGGAHNQHLIKLLKENLTGINIQNTHELGIEADWVEAAAFAWLAHQTQHQLSGNLPSVTGALKKLVLGVTHLPH